MTVMPEKNWSLGKRAWLLILLDITVVFAIFYMLVRTQPVERRSSRWWVLAFFFLCVHFALFYIILRITLIPLLNLERTVRSIGTQTNDSRVKMLDTSGEIGTTGTNGLINVVKNALYNEYTSQILKSQAEMSALQSQINPHFLYNTLDTIRSHALTQKSIEIAEMTESLATLFRNNVSSTDSMATFAAELDNVENYLIIQRYRFPEKFTFIKKIEDDDIYDYKMPVLTMQPLVENAIHHGLELKSGHGTVTIRAFFTQDTLTIYVIDDGIGMDSDRFKALEIALAENKTPQIQNIRKNSGIAMINVNQRIKFFYGSNYGLRVYSTHCVGTTIEIRLPKANA